MENIVPTRGGRRSFNIDLDATGVEVSPASSNRTSFVLYNTGPDTAWGGKTLAEASPDVGFPILAGGGMVDNDSSDAWCFRTDTGETANIRGWEVVQI